MDEKWIKIRGTWYYWFMALDEATELPLAEYLAARRSGWVCRWLGVQLKQTGMWIKALCTDGLASYGKMLPEIPHLLCHFHHQRGVTSWLKEHKPTPEDVPERKQAMKQVLQTNKKILGPYHINRMTREEVYELLRREVPEEVRAYLENVVERMRYYRKS